MRLMPSELLELLIKAGKGWMRDGECHGIQDCKKTKQINKPVS